jgi:serine/threonine protein kinase, bacterial
VAGQDAADGTPFGRYRLIGLIGKGGMGAVYKAHDAMLRRDVAIKILPTELAAEEGYRERFQREAYAAARLTEPHIIPIHDYGEIEGRLFLVMPVIKGTDVATVLHRDGPMTPERAVSVIEQLAAALDVAHEAGLVHRDIKPSNALLADHDFVYLIDFGIAHDASATKLTRSGTTVGTWAYMAPERFTTGTADARVDVYALACVLYECLTGWLPYPGDSMPQQYHGHVAVDPPKPTAVNPAIPAGFDEVIARGMAKDPGQRYRTASELAAAAQEALTEPGPTPPEPAELTELTDSTKTEDRPLPGPGPTLVDEHNLPVPEPTLAGDATFSTAASKPPVPASQSDPTLHAGQPRNVGQRADEIGQQPTQLAPTGPIPSAQRAPGSEARVGRLSRRTKIIAAAAGALVIVIVAVIAIVASQSGSPGPTVLPFTGLTGAHGVAADTAGNVYVTEFGNDRVLKLPAGASTSTPLPFTGVKAPTGVAVDSAGNVYVASINEPSNDWVLKLPAGASTPTTLPFTGLTDPSGVAVDSAGNLYVVDSGNNRVLKLPAGASTPTTLPFTGLTKPQGVAVDTAGNLDVVDSGNNRVLKLPAGASTPTTLPFTGLTNPRGVAVDTAGNVYVGGQNGMFKLPAGASTSTTLPFTGNVNGEPKLAGPGDPGDVMDVAVDTAGNVYVLSSNNKVLKLPAR